MPISRELFDWGNLAHIEDGADSEVYRRSDQVIKRYRSDIPLPVVSKYSALTNRAVAYLDQNPEYCYLLPEENMPSTFRARYEVVPVGTIRVDQNNRAVTISQFISGPSLDDLRTEGVVKWEKEIPHLRKMWEAIERRRATPYVYEFSGILDRALQTWDINLDEVNTKVVFDPKGGLRFVLTDLGYALKTMKDLWLQF